ncbi:hypothetical protein FACS1894200_09440 [Spirochaetia bacterium]|nr:hypothetical protein FACS1894200_09440 [Spirochaetia bacterium]
MHTHGMKYTPKLFLEASVFNFYRDGKQGQKRLDTIKLFHRIAAGEYKAYTSLYVIDELEAASEKNDSMR